MAYKIRYGPDHPKWHRKATAKKLTPLLWIPLLLIGAFLIQRSVLLHDPHTAQALESLADALQQGEGFREAVTTFCREIISDAVY